LTVHLKANPRHGSGDLDRLSSSRHTLDTDLEILIDCPPQDIDMDLEILIDCPPQDIAIETDLDWWSQERRIN
jgi:hypothetical protein